MMYNHNRISRHSLPWQQSCLLAIFVFLSAFSAKSQLVAGEYSGITLISDDFHINNWNSGSCYDFEIDLNMSAYYNVTGMTSYFRLDSLLSNSDSLKISYQQEHTYLHVEDSIIIGYNIIPIYVDTSTTVYYTINAYGTPMISNEPYDCVFTEQYISWEDGCNNNGIWFRANTDSCTVLPGEFQLTNDSCITPIELQLGLNWANNFNATPEPDIEIDCFDDVESNTTENGVWYSFTTPEDYKRIRLRSTSTQCDTVELVGTQMAVFTSCDSEPIACSSPGDSLFADITFECGELELNTTYYLLLDGWAGETGICRLFYNIYNSCPPGCTDSTACNYNENSYTDDGSCLYGDACIPTHELTVDTIDCHNFIINSDVSWSPFFEPYFYWTINGSPPVWFDPYPYSLNLSDLTEGYYEICLLVSYFEGSSQSCIEIYVPESCDEFCTTEIAITDLGCTKMFSLVPEAPSDYVFLWDLGDGEPIIEGDELFATFSEDGDYTTCIALNNYYGCVDTTLCVDFSVLDCIVDSTFYGCIDTAACNYNPEALIDNGTCLYEPDCSPSVELIVDTIDCRNFIVYVEITLPIPPSSSLNLWAFGDTLIEYSIPPDSIVLTDLEPGGYSGCFYYISSGTWVDCIEINVPDTCVQPCIAEIGVVQDECFAEYSLIPYPPIDSVFTWDLGNGEILESGGIVSTNYLEDGDYTICVELENYAGCIDSTLCTNIVIDDCFSDTTIYGCLDSLAVNYNPAANVSDSSCIYLTDCSFTLTSSVDSLDASLLVISLSIEDSTLVDVFWDFGDGSTSNEISPNYYYSDSGVYQLCCIANFIVDSGECNATSCIDIEVPETGLELDFIYGENGSITSTTEIENTIDILFWPNPASDLLSWKLNQNYSGNFSISIFDNSGKEVFEKEISGSTTGEISLNNLNPGLYLIKLNGGFGTSQFKLIVLK